jgi:hemimethylated DNA binding protein
MNGVLGSLIRQPGVMSSGLVGQPPPICGVRPHHHIFRDSNDDKATPQAFQPSLQTAPSRRGLLKAHASAQKGSLDAAIASLTCEQSAMVNKEIVLFLFQVEMDAQLQRALTYEKFDVAQEVRERRSQVDAALRELQEAKGYGCGARRASHSAQLDYAPSALSLRARLAAAISDERYADAAQLRDELAALEERAAEADLPCPVTEPRYTLGQMVVHSSKGYRGVVAGWDLACCETPEWQAAAGVDRLAGGNEQVFYHVLVDATDWPVGLADDDPPVAYVAEEHLSAVSLADFAAAEPLVDSAFSHPYSYLMFLGSDGHGNMIPCRQLRDKYCLQRQDRYPPGASPEFSDSDEDDDGGYGGDNGGGGGGGGSGGDGDGGIWSGGDSIPGIDMSSLQ